MTMHVRLLLLLALGQATLARANDPLDWSELQLLYAADLAIDARFVRQDDAHVWVKVAVVLRDRDFGIRAGDVVRVDKAASYDCGYSWNIGEQRRWRMYLQKEEGKAHWALSRHNAGSAIHFIHDRAIMHMPAWVELPIAEFDRCMLEFQTCYASADSGNTFTPRCTQARIDSLAANNAILAQFEKQGRTVTAASLFPVDPIFAEPVPAATHPDPPPPIRECVWLEQQPRSLSAGTDTNGPSIQFTLSDPTPGVLGAGNVIVRVLIDTDGSLRDATILRGSTPQRETEALRALAAAPRLEPGRDNGVPTACYEVIPFRFKLTEE
jgi:TonB family protein